MSDKEGRWKGDVMADLELSDCVVEQAVDGDKTCELLLRTTVSEGMSEDGGTFGARQ